MGRDKQLFDLLFNLVKVQLVNNIETTETLLKSLKDDQVYMQSICYGLPFRFRVFIKSGWASYGENDLTYEGSGKLSEVMFEAIYRFKEINKRSDVQGDYIVSVILPYGTSIPLPKELWIEYHYLWGVSESMKKYIVADKQ